MKITVLGTGTSVGIPSLGPLGWGNCDPLNPKNRRQRCALLVQHKETNILVDAGPDIKNQLIENKVRHLDAVLITHEHSDHVAGLDELRAFYFRDKVKLKLFTYKRTAKYLIKRFDYLFLKNDNSQSYFKPPLVIEEINYNTKFNINGLQITPIRQNHGAMDSIGFILNYCWGSIGFLLVFYWITVGIL